MDSNAYKMVQLTAREMLTDKKDKFTTPDLTFLSQVKFCDVILCNRYYAWYHDFGQTQLISKQLEVELRDWFNNYGKPVIQAEYGADTVSGMHVVRT